MIQESKEDLMAAFKLDPVNKAVKKELQHLKASGMFSIFCYVWFAAINGDTSSAALAFLTG